MATQSRRDGRSVAVTGLSCRFPGDGDTLDHFWESICHGESAWSEIPRERFNVEAFHSTSGNVNTSITRGAHFLKDDITKFDANFFGVSKAEASSMDPQHRLMIEVAYQSLENAGLSIKDVAGSKTGVFVGHHTSDYRELLFKDPDTAPMYTYSGSTKTSLANRISWLFDLHGPSFSLDTACSSSLVALHLACQSLRSGECNTAIVGGVNLLLNPEMFMFLSNQHFLSPDGKCKSFDESSDGYGRGEGIAAIVLKRVDEAVTGRDPIRAVIRSTGSNQDGHTKGFTLPSADAQAALIRDTYAAADLDFRSTGYVEAHGTGTQAGDTEETLALSETVSKGRPSDDPLYIGSVKTNIGHLEACAGLAGILKSILILERGVIPPTIHYKKGNAKIKFEQWGLKVATALTPWPASRLRRISVNSFGYGGTNAHAILDDAYHYLQSFEVQGMHHTQISGRAFENGERMKWSSISGFPSSPVKRRFSEHAHGVFDGVSNYGAKSTQKAVSHDATNIKIRSRKKDDINRDERLYKKNPIEVDERPQNNGNDGGAEADSRIFLFSAQDKEGLTRTKKALADHLMSRLEDETCNTQAYLSDLSFTLSRRATLQWRTSCAATSIEHLLGVLQDEEILSATRASDNPRIGFVFTGQGAQWPRMGVELMVYPAFRESIQAADQHLREACSCAWAVEDELMKGKFSSRLHLAVFSQTICTVLQVAMVDLLWTWSITPVAVAGHSSGEIAAAYCLGALSREDAWRVAYYRGIVSTALKEVAPDISGSMMAVGLSPKQAEMWISQAENEGEVVLACINSPSSVTLSGDKADIDRMAAKFAENGIFARKLKVDTAYHSPHMQVVAQDYFEHISDLQTQTPTGQCRMHSSVTGCQIRPDELGAANWVRNLTSPVQFAKAIYDMVRPVQNNGRRGEENAVDLLIEIGPHPALQGPSTQTLKTHGITNMPYETVLQREQDGLQTAQALAGAVFTRGGLINSLSVNNESCKENISLLVDLPSYPWNHSQGYWEESRLAREFRHRKQPPLSLLGAPSSSFAPGEYLWRKFIRLSEEPWLSDHQIGSSILYPGAGFLAMAFEAAHQIADPHRKIAGFHLRDVQLTTALIISEDTDIECAVQLRPHFTGTRQSDYTWLDFVVTTSPNAETPQRNCSGLLLIDYEQGKDSSLSQEWEVESEHLQLRCREAASLCKQHIAPEVFYRNLAAIGLKYGPVFKNLKEIRSGNGKSLCTVEVPETYAAVTAEATKRPHVIHPGTLDAMFHGAFAAIQRVDDDLRQAMVPRAIEEVFVSADVPFQTGARMGGFSNAETHGLKELKADIIVFAEDAAHPVVKIIGFVCTEIGISGSASENNVGLRSLCSKLTWKPAIQLLSAEETERAIKDACRSEGEDGLTNLVWRDEANALTCIDHALKTVAVDQVSPTKRALWERMQSQNQITDSPDHLRQGFLDHTHSPSECNIDIVQVENLSKGLKGHLMANKSDSDVEAIASQTGHLMQSAAIKLLLRQLGEYLRLLHFTDPQFSILELSATPAQVAPVSMLNHIPGLDVLQQTLRYTTALSSAGTLAEAQKLKSGVEYIIFDADKDSEIQGAPGRKFDVILAFDLANISERPDTALANVRSLLKEGGDICALDISSPRAYLSMLTEAGGARANSLRPALARDDLKLHLALSDVDNPSLRQAELLIARAAVDTHRSHDQEEIFIIQPARLSEKAHAASQKISEALANCSCQTTIFSWGSDLSTMKDKACISLLELERPMLSDMSEEDFGLLKKFMTEVQKVLWIVGFDGPSSGMVSGLARVVRNENPSISFRTVHTNIATSSSLEWLGSAIARVSRSRTEDDEFRIEDNTISISRIEEDLVVNKQIHALLPNAPDFVDMVPLSQAGGPVKLFIQNPGMMDSLCFESDELPMMELEADEVEIDVKATALNFREVMVVMGQIPDRLLGFDAAGIVRRVGSGVRKLKVGDGVAMYGHGSHRSIHRSKADFCALVPENLSYEQAATIPVVHGTAWYALVQLARVVKGQSILIHAAAGGVGQAAIQIAQHYQLDIIATVGSGRKRKLLREEYGLSNDRILSSRDLSFVKGIKRLTRGRGVDVILNSLSGEFLTQTWHCLAPFGTFIEIGIKDILDNTGLDMRPFLQSTSYTFFNLNHLERDRPDVMGKIIFETFELQRQKITRPITPVKVYGISDVEKAFRLMQSGQHLGKVVLSFGDTSPIPVIRRKAEATQLDSNAAYVIVGGFGGLGRSISNLLVDLGARRLCFLSRSGDSSAEAQRLIHDLRSRRVRAQAYVCDVADPAAVGQSISKCLMEIGPIRGVLQCAMVLSDVFFMKMSYNDWIQAVKPKVQGTWNIHLNLKDLDFFVSLSSFAATFGNLGQSNYAAAGAYQDAMAYHRRSLGLHAVTLDLGIMRDVGVLAEKGITDSLREWEKPYGIWEFELHALLKQVIVGDMTGDVAPQVLTGLATGGSVLDAGISTPFYLQRDARFSIMARTGVRAQQSGDGNGSQKPGNSTQTLLSKAASMPEAAKVVTDALVGRLAKMLQTAESEIDTGRFLHSYGVDSLTAIELVNWALRELKATVSVIEVMASVPITTTARQIASSSTLYQASNVA